jgi:L-aminoadipate-semialdehyde dehydrogenase
LHPYSTLKAANVLSTLECIRLCATGKSKRLAFISSTSALDTEHFVQQSDSGTPVSESDDLASSAQGLGTGYGQTKWVSECLIREACHRGLNAVIIRSGYVMGHSTSGVSNTDDFLVRMLKGCIQVRARPDVTNTINMVPVDRVARLVNAVAFHAESGKLAHVDARPRLTFNEYLGFLENYGYTVPQVPYAEWKAKVETYVETVPQTGFDELALLGLYHMVTGDLPSATKAPNLDDANSQAALKADDAEQEKATPSAVDENAVGKYLSFLIQRGFMPKPEEKGRRDLPGAELGKEQVEALDKVGGRGGGKS